MTNKELIEKLKEHSDDTEVFVSNSAEACFDGVGQVIELRVIEGDKKYIALIQNNDVLKP